MPKCSPTSSRTPPSPPSSCSAPTPSTVRQLLTRGHLRAPVNVCAWPDLCALLVTPPCPRPSALTRPFLNCIPYPFPHLLLCPAEVPLQRVFGNTNPKIIVFTVDWSDATKAAVIAASRALDGQADVIGANFAEGERAAGFFGVEKGDMPVVAAHNPATDQKFIGAPRAAVTAAAIETFARGVIDGTLEAHIKSEPVPTSNDGPVRVIVASTFEEEVMGGKDVMIEFYAPW